MCGIFPLSKQKCKMWLSSPRGFTRALSVLTFWRSDSGLCSGIVTPPSQGLREDSVITECNGDCMIGVVDINNCHLIHKTSA